MNWSLLVSWITFEKARNAGGGGGGGEDVQYSFCVLCCYTMQVVIFNMYCIPHKKKKKVDVRVRQREREKCISPSCRRQMCQWTSYRQYMEERKCTMLHCNSIVYFFPASWKRTVRNAFFFVLFFLKTLPFASPYQVSIWSFSLAIV